jgi:hypothetical protein
MSEKLCAAVHDFLASFVDPFDAKRKIVASAAMRASG